MITLATNITGDDLWWIVWIILMLVFLVIYAAGPRPK